MAKGTKEKKQVIKSKGQKKSKVSKENLKKSTKDEKFSFDEEVIIGLKRLDKDVDKKSYDIPEIGSTKGEEARAKQKKNSKKKKNKKKVQKKLTPQQELAKKKRKAIFHITKWIMLIAIVIGAVIYALLSPLFNIHTINVVGNSKISSDEIISLSTMQIDQNMFKYQKKDIIKKIKENAYINTVKISRKLPDRIEIVVTERKTSFMLQFANAYAYISSQGYILEISNKKLDLPILKGFETELENIQTGYRLCTSDLKKLGDVLKIMEAATSNKLAKLITQIDITDDENYILTLQKKKKTVYLGDTSNLSTKMLWILYFNEHEKDKRGDIILNMNLNDEKSNPYFRENV